jgi:ADP-ribosylglycohydrolase
MKVTDHILGCIVGGAIGDCLGGASEGSAIPVTFPFSRPCVLSDDTQLTLATCEAIVEANGAVNPSVIAGRFAAWYRAGWVTGLGASTYKALSELANGSHWALVGSKGERAAGNGAAMRVAPLAFCLDPHDASARQVIRDVCRITHHNEEAYAGALAVVAAVRAAWTRRWKPGTNLLVIAFDALPDSRVRDRIAEYLKVESNASITDVARFFGCSGYTVESVPLALYGAQQVSRLGFAGVLEELIAAGGDTDTNAAIAGQIAGTLIGRSQLPPTLVSRLPELDLIESAAEDFARKVEG